MPAPHSQTDAEQLWSQIRLNENLEIFNLPGRSGGTPHEPNLNNPAANTCLLGGVAITNERLPSVTTQVKNVFGNAPNAFFRLSSNTVLGLVEDMNKTQHLLHLSVGGILKHLATLKPEGRPLEVGRSGEGGPRLNDRKVSWKHISVGRIGTAWVVNDLGSLNGTEVAVEAGTSLGPVDPSKLKESLDLPSFLDVTGRELVSQ